MRAEILRVEEGMKAVRPETGITFEERWNVPGLSAEPDGEAEALVRRLTGENGSSRSSATAPKRGSSRPRAIPPSFAGPAISPRPISRTNI
jgi:hypothetical protein